MGASLKPCGSKVVLRSSQVKPVVQGRDSKAQGGLQDRTLPISFHRKYELTQKLGEGSFATVYRVVDANGEFPEKDLVAKVVDLAVLDIKKEIGIMLKVSHLECCVRLLHYFLEGTFGYIVMERCDLEFLDFLCSRTNLDERSFVQHAKEVLAALAAIHNLNIVHRDVKPENILFSTSSGMLKLCDFGLSVTLTRTNPFATGVKGTVAFMSPEMLTHQPYGASIDVWSLGVLMYAILLGDFPYTTRSRDRLELITSIIVGLPVPSFRPASSIESCSAVSIALLQKLINRNATTRVTAEEALEHPWFQVSETSSHCRHSMIPAIISARNVFPSRRSAQSGGIDPRLMVLQNASRKSRASYRQEGAEFKLSGFDSVSPTSAGSPWIDARGSRSSRFSLTGSSHNIWL